MSPKQEVPKQKMEGLCEGLLLLGKLKLHFPLRAFFPSVRPPDLHQPNAAHSLSAGGGREIIFVVVVFFMKAELHFASWMQPEAVMTLCGMFIILPSLKGISSWRAAPLRSSRKCCFE